MKNLQTSEDGEMMCQFMQEVTEGFASLPQITVAAIQGRALGGGAEVRDHVLWDG